MFCGGWDILEICFDWCVMVQSEWKNLIGVVCFGHMLRCVCVCRYGITFVLTEAEAAITPG